MRSGVAAGGNWIVDRVNLIDRLPGRGMLGSILSEERATGGGPANVLFDLARLGASFPLVGLGVVGRDDDGQFVLARAREHGVDVSHIVLSDRARTSFTDVMSEAGTGERMFFHHRGANALFGPEHVPAAELSCRIFYLAYLLLMDRMDEPDAEHGTAAARLLCDLRSRGIRTCVDVVSEESDRFGNIVPPALRHADYVILNEIEAGRTMGRVVRRPGGSLDGAALAEVVDALAALGDAEVVAVHMPEGFYVRERSGRRHSGGSLVLPDGFIQGSVGAGDAFCAGMLFGLHEGWEVAEAAWIGTCSAAACLASNTATDGALSVADALRLGEKFPVRPAPVSL